MTDQDTNGGLRLKSGSAIARSCSKRSPNWAKCTWSGTANIMQGLSRGQFRINRRPELGAKLLDRFFHRRRQVSPPVNPLLRRFPAFPLLQYDGRLRIALSPLF